MDRQDQVDAAVGLARRYGVDVREPVLLRSTNNLVVHLAPAPVVAKVGRLTSDQGGLALRKELAVALHLAALGAPIAAPSPVLPAVVHEVGEQRITFWRYHEERNSGEIPCARLAPALSEFHHCLRSYPGPLPDFRLRRAGADDLIRSAVSPRLKERDRLFLLTEHARIQSELTAADFEPQPLHGGPHRHNWIDTGERALLIDLETVCIGPRELDIAYVHGCAPDFPGIDLQLLTLLREAISLGVSIACWARMDEVPELAWHAAHHLGVLRARAWARRRRIQPRS
jgi:Ser/Thr protein kinase RdoA (MazF antagonist)